MTTHNKKRRDFVKKTSLLALGALTLNSQSLMAKSKADVVQTWYITGASGGLGYELAKYLLAKGDKVALTSRKIENLEKKFGKESENMLFLELKFDKDLDAQIKANMQKIKAKFKRLDNVVNNAGYGLLGFVEEISQKELREQFEVNLFAPFLIAQNALKMMRQQCKNEKGSEENIRDF